MMNQSTTPCRTALLRSLFAAGCAAMMLFSTVPAFAQKGRAPVSDQSGDSNTPYVRSRDAKPAPAGPIRNVAGSVVVPSTTETSGINTPLRDTARVYQAYYHQSQLAGITAPTQITGMRLRIIAASIDIRGANNFPTADITFSQYDVQLSRASTAIRTAGEIPSSSTTFADNQDAPTVVTTRSGALTIPANSYLGNAASTPASPNAFGATIAFTTPYIINPGEELMITIRHSGAPGGAGSTGNVIFFATADFGNNVADAVSATSGGSGATTPTGFSSPLFFEFVTAPAVTGPVNVDSQVSFTTTTVGLTGNGVAACGTLGYTNQYSLNVDLRNIGTNTFTSPFFQVIELQQTDGVVANPFRLRTADDFNGATCSGGLVGTTQAIPGPITPNQVVPVNFQIAMPQLRRFRFLVSVFATTTGSVTRNGQTFKLGNLAVEATGFDKAGNPILSSTFIPEKGAPTFALNRVSVTRVK
jgi:hypothetical protein